MKSLLTASGLLMIIALSNAVAAGAPYTDESPRAQLIDGGEHSAESIELTLADPQTIESNRRVYPLVDILENESVRRTASSLAVVIGLFLLYVVLSKSFRTKQAYHDEMIELLGRKSVTPKHHLHLVRIQNRILLLAETPNGLQSLDRIDENSGAQPCEITPQTNGNLRSSEAGVELDDDAEKLLGMIRSKSSSLSVASGRR